MRHSRSWLLAAWLVLQGLTAAAQNAAPPPVAPTTASAADQVPVAARETAVQLRLDVVYEQLSNGYAPWRSAAFGMRAVRPRGSVRAGVEETTRFSQLDHNLTLGLERRLSSRWTIGGEAQSSPSHHVLPTWSALGHAAFVAGRGWGVQADVRHVVYPSTSVDQAALTAERYISRYRTAYTVYTARLREGETSVSHRVHADVYYGALSSSVGLSLSAGQEVESLVPFGVLRTPVRTGAIVGRQWVRPAWFVSYEAVVHDQGDFYVRRRISVGVGHRF